MGNGEKGPKGALTLAVTLIVYAGTSFANSIPALDFALAPTTASGTVSYAGGANPLVGLSIPVSSVTGLNTAAHNGMSVPILNGQLDFFTGNFVKSTANSWVFSAGFFPGVVLVGCADIDLDHDTTCDSSDDGGFLGVLALGVFTKNTQVSVSGNQFQIIGATGLDIKDQTLLTFFHMPNLFYSYTLNYGFTGSGLPPGAFTSTAGGSGNFINQPAVVPEPNSLVLLVTGLLVLAGVARRKLRTT